MPTLPTLCITGKLDRCVTHYFRNCTLTWVSPSPGISYIFSTGRARLIRSLSSARISFELSGNLNLTMPCNSNFGQNFKLEISLN